jgi:LDH2 family malate/lactate/ureidoglycolate dehydrogenase
MEAGTALLVNAGTCKKISYNFKNLPAPSPKDQGINLMDFMKGEKQVLIPGDIEREMEEVRMKEGIPLLQQVIDDLNSLAVKFKVDF